VNADLLSCNVIMKGGITSGVVYPRAVSTLSRSFRFRQLGGASAGAIAASLAAAAEYRRAISPSAADRAGFDRLDAMPAFLGENLLRLFQPEAATEPVFAVLISFLGSDAGWRKALRAIGGGIGALPGCALLGLLPAAALLVLCVERTSGIWSTALVGVAAMLAAAAGMLVAIAIGLALRIGRELPRNGFGLCRALAGTPSLTGWLAEEIDLTAGKRDSPLTFGDLRRQEIDLRMPTTSLGHGRPYRLPLETSTFFYRPDELRGYLPERIVRWMEDHVRGPREGEDRTFALLPKGMVALPEPDDLPVVFGARMSLSFPFLLSAIPLYVIDFQEPERRPGVRDNADIKKAPQPGETLHPSRCWMSDGGIGSNFPIHFFDQPLPLWPTFGLDLWPVKPGRKLGPTPGDNVVLPANNVQGAFDRFLPFASEEGFGALASFTGALVNALHAWMDNQQAKVPGFRDRVAHVKLAPDEGGLNLTMPPSLIAALSDRGRAAGERFTQRFAEGTDEFGGLDNHRWVRLRSLLPLIAQLAAEVRVALARPPESGSDSYPDLLARSGAKGRSYSTTAAEREAATWLLEQLSTIDAELKRRDIDFREGEPRPPPVLRISPDV
jgi:Patatin-like phospholipase